MKVAAVVLVLLTVAARVEAQSCPSLCGQAQAACEKQCSPPNLDKGERNYGFYEFAYKLHRDCLDRCQDKGDHCTSGCPSTNRYRNYR